MPPSVDSSGYTNLKNRWLLVGGPFDHGNLPQAELSLRRSFVLAALRALHHTPVDSFAAETAPSNTPPTDRNQPMTRFVYNLHRTQPNTDPSNGWQPWMTDAPKQEARPRIACSSCTALYPPHLISKFGECVDCI